MSLLASRSEIDSARIGLWAPSQGAWVASTLSTMTPDIAFLAVMSGGGVTPRESETWAYDRELDNRGAGDEERRRAHGLLDAYFAYLATGEGRAALLERIEAAKTAPWYEALQLQNVLPSEENRRNWEWVATYDPLPAIQSMQFPVLLLFGEKDEQQPTRHAVDRWIRGLREAGNTRWRVRLFEGAGHGLAPGDHGSGQEPPRLESTISWLRRESRLDDPDAVVSFGSLRAIRQEGDLGGPATLADWAPSPCLVAVGALSDRRGVITALDGRIWLSRPGTAASAVTEESDASDETAALLVVAEVPRWVEVAFPKGIAFEEIDDTVRDLAGVAGIDAASPFPFVIEGQLRDLGWHTIDGRRLDAGISEQRDTASATLVGFHSGSDQGVFTDHDGRTHIHVVVEDPLASGHLDHVTIPAGTRLRLPAPSRGPASRK